MTEDRWLQSTHVDAMIDQCLALPVPRPFNGRKKRLFACGCFRLLWPSIRCPLVRRAVETAEDYADRRASAGELDQQRYPTGGVAINSLDHRLQIAIQSLMISNLNPAFLAWQVRASDDPFRYGPNRYSEGCPEQTELLREILGNPFQRVKCDPSWRTSTATALARQMYDSRDFSAMPILADALQDAGCDNDDILDHCRGIGPHVRGCWVVDLVLGKT